MNKQKRTGEITQEQKKSDDHSQLVKEEMTIIDLFLILLKHIKAIIIIPTVISILAIIYVLFLAKPIYIA